MGGGYCPTKTEGVLSWGCFVMGGGLSGHQNKNNENSNLNFGWADFKHALNTCFFCGIGKVVYNICISKRILNS